MFKKLVLALLLGFSINGIYCQTINHPNYGLKSHPTLNIESVVLSLSSTQLFMVIENQSLDGTFCADKKIFLILPDGERLKIAETDGIPRCPETHIFQTYGEKLYFSLKFDAIPAGTQWFDIIEDCDNACFSFNSVILDGGLNQRIDHAYTLTESKKPEEACKEFEKLLDDFSGKKCSYEGAIYWNLVHLTKLMGDDKKSAEWLDILKNSDVPMKERFLENLRKN
jgi:hypothetical protein